MRLFALVVGFSLVVVAVSLPVRAQDTSPLYYAAQLGGGSLAALAGGLGGTLVGGLSGALRSLRDLQDDRSARP